MTQETRVVHKKRFVKEEEAAELFGLSTKTLRNWRTLDRGPRYRKFGSAVRYDIRDLETYFQSAPSGGERPPAA